MASNIHNGMPLLVARQVVEDHTMVLLVTMMLIGPNTPTLMLIDTSSTSWNVPPYNDVSARAMASYAAEWEHQISQHENEKTILSPYSLCQSRALDTSKFCATSRRRRIASDLVARTARRLPVTKKIDPIRLPFIGGVAFSSQQS